MPTRTRGWGVTEPARLPGLPPDDNEQVDVRVHKLKLVSALGKAGVNVNVTDILTDGKLEDSMVGAPQFTLDLLDRDFRVLKSGVFGQKVDVDLDHVPFRLVEVSVTDTDRLELLFEHKIVNLLRGHKSPLKAVRGTTTRAQFVERLLREITSDMPVNFISPQEDVVQPIGAAKASGRTLKVKKLSGTTLNVVTQAGRQPGFGVQSLVIRQFDGGALHLGPGELGNAATVLGVAKQLNAPAKAVLALVEACIVEAPGFANSGIAVDHTSTGILQLLSSTAAGLGISALDVAACANAFLTKGFYGHGGAITQALRNPGLSAGTIAQNTQGSGFPSRYDAVQGSALNVIRAWAGGTGFSASAFSSFASAGRTTLTTLPYEFSRGQPGQPEDSWTCMQRLASEVNWRCFVAGRHNVYFVTDDDLLVTQTKYTIAPGDQGVGKLTFHAEVGGRTILRKGRRQPKPSDALLDVRVDRWSAPPGTVVTLEDYGPGDGDWLVADIQRPLFDATGQITLAAPQKALPEPAPQTKTTTIPGTAGSGTVPNLNITGLSTSSNPIDRVFAAAAVITRRHLPYGPGGHGLNWPAAANASNMDCSSSTSAALWMAGLFNGFSGPIVSGEFGRWGVPGRGRQMTIWWNGGHVFVEFYGKAAARFDTVPGGGPQLRYDTGLYGFESSGFNAQHLAGF